AFTARLKSCPDTKRVIETRSTSFSAACKGRVHFADIAAVKAKALTYQSCSFKASVLVKLNQRELMPCESLAAKKRWRHLNLGLLDI
ncbi:MAG: hypothetical protein WAK26_04355, partial [Terracidiphilus sp.]